MSLAPRSTSPRRDIRVVITGTHVVIRAGAPTTLRRLAGSEVHLDLDVVADVAAAGPDHIEFTNARPVSPAAERRWLETVDYAARALGDADGDEASALVATEVDRLLAAVALATFPNTVTGPGHDGGATATEVPSETLRAALAYIDEHADESLALADIADAVSVTPRALQLAFRRHLDTTPMAHLRRVRLARVHEELAAADPASGTTVTEVAARWGFCGSSRFTSYYREVYGRNPSETLAG